MKLLGCELEYVGVLDLRLRVWPIDESAAGKERHDAKRAAHWWNENNACRQDQVQRGRTSNQSRNLGPKRFAIDLKVFEKPALVR